MNDRELLELSAKAAGIEVEWNDRWNSFNRTSDGGGVLFTSAPWDPLVADGDALRLAARLNFRVDISYGTVRIVDELDNEHYLSGIVTDCGGQMAIVRRAIVRAAAAIGEAM